MRKLVVTGLIGFVSVMACGRSEMSGTSSSGIHGAAPQAGGASGAHGAAPQAGGASGASICPTDQLNDGTGTCAPMAGVTWIQRATAQNWGEVASSADGTKLVAVVSGGGESHGYRPAGLQRGEAQRGSCWRGRRNHQQRYSGCRWCDNLRRPATKSCESFFEAAHQTADSAASKGPVP